MIYLLDTNACIEYLRGRNAKLISRVQAMPYAEMRLCSVVKAELYAGAFHSRQRQRNLKQIETFMAPFHSLPFDDPAAEAYGEIRADLEAKGMLIGPNDLMIAAIALTNGVTLVTHNVAEFSRVSGLVIDDWQS